MTPLPRWFLATLAACAVLATVATVYRNVRQADVGRWAAWGDDGIIDTRTGVGCAPAAGGFARCIELSAGRRMPLRADPPKSAAHPSARVADTVDLDSVFAEEWDSIATAKSPR